MRSSTAQDPLSIHGPADVVLREAARRLSVPATDTALCVQNRACLVRALHTRPDRLTEPLPATT